MGQAEQDSEEARWQSRLIAVIQAIAMGVLPTSPASWSQSALNDLAGRGITIAIY
ncbi:MAG: hypothetical protein WA020_16620 [Candidatus Acidiferrales bacterium]